MVDGAVVVNRVACRCFRKLIAGCEDAQLGQQEQDAGKEQEQEQEQWRLSKERGSGKKIKQDVGSKRLPNCL
jgi:hypothetical protein